jgi:cobalt/nickel transport system permease protein
MHISEGVLSAPILIGGAIVSTSLLALAIKRLQTQETPLVAVCAALFFVGSFIHIPMGPTSLHLVLNGIIGAILGLRAFIAIAIALFLQGLLFGYGGLSTLGINTFNMALPALIAGSILYINIKNPFMQKLQFFSIGFLAISLSALLLALTLALNDASLITAAKISFFANLPLMFTEGIITMFAMIFLQNSYPNLLKKKN